MILITAIFTVCCEQKKTLIPHAKHTAKVNWMFITGVPEVSFHLKKWPWYLGWSRHCHYEVWRNLNIYVWNVYCIMNPIQKYDPFSHGTELCPCRCVESCIYSFFLKNAFIMLSITLTFISYIHKHKQFVHINHTSTHKMHREIHINTETQKKTASRQWLSGSPLSAVVLPYVVSHEDWRVAARLGETAELQVGHEAGARCPRKRWYRCPSTSIWVGSAGSEAAAMAEMADEERCNYWRPISLKTETETEMER